jgi:excisionase family DNA binding protein
VRENNPYSPVEGPDADFSQDEGEQTLSLGVEAVDARRRMAASIRDGRGRRRDDEIRHLPHPEFLWMGRTGRRARCRGLWEWEKYTPPGRGGVGFLFMGGMAVHTPSDEPADSQPGPALPGNGETDGDVEMTLQQIGKGTDDPALYTPGQAAARLGISETTIRSWIFRNRIGVRRVGTRVFIPRDELERLAERP